MYLQPWGSAPLTTLAVQPVILCGGNGTRLWPLSRTGFPKQFLCLTGKDSLFQLAAKRITGLEADGVVASRPLVVTNEAHWFLALEQLRETGIEVDSLLLEPAGRNTAPALTLAALHALESGTDPVLVACPADHLITDTAAFSRAVQLAVTEAARNRIVVFGVVPDRPETAYGYIKTDAPLQQDQILRVKSFTEKPDAATASRYLGAGCYFWNSGIFVLKASVWMAAIETFRPDIAQATRNAWKRRSIDGKFVRPDADTFATIPQESIDYAVMEKCPDSAFSLRAVALDAGWSDLGTWDAVWRALPKDADDNAHFGDVVASKSRNTLVFASSRLVGLVGIDNAVVIETPDAVLIANPSHGQQVKAIVEALGEAGREEPLFHRKVHRPWGWYDNLDAGNQFKVKRIMVKPRASLSLQKHRHRAEHWVVVQGTAEITRGEQTFLLQENQSTYISPGRIHRLANPRATPLEIIEVQTGNYLSEDDIVRFDDVYGRDTD